MTLDAEFAAIREQLLLRDEHRLARLLGRPGKLDESRFRADVEKALRAAENRARLAPVKIAYPAELPVSQAREEILAAIRDNPVVVVCGETGSGKTTQLPKLCLELGRGRRGLIGHTQPRRLAARTVAQRIAQELETRLGGLVGYETRFDRRVSEQSMVKLMTDGILLAELQRDHELLAYDTIIIDEAHERTLNIDFLLGWLARLLPRRPDLKVIVTSATLEPEKLAAHFSNHVVVDAPPARGELVEPRMPAPTGPSTHSAGSGPGRAVGGAAVPILTVQGRTFPVEQRYRAPPKDADLEDEVAAAIDELWRKRPADVLVFLPGEREIHDLRRSLPGRFPRAQVLPLYSRLPAQQQDLVFQTGGAPKIVLSTNVAETSLTVPGIRYVVDAGTARLARYSPRQGVQQLRIEPISQAAANQRAGRCGRVGPGICIRLYSEEDFAGRDAFTEPEILRSNLAGVILQMAALDLGNVSAFPWIDPPEPRHIAEGYNLLQALGALDDDRVLTPMGRELGRLPLDPRIARIALAGRGGPVEREVCVLAAALSVQDPHDVPPDAQEAARTKHAEWRHSKSDFISLLNLWQRWQEWNAQGSNHQVRKRCRENFVSYLRMEEWESVHKQLRELLGARSGEGAAVLKPEEAYVPIHKALLAGLVDHIGYKLPENQEFQGPRGRRFRIFPASALAKKPPPWVMSAQLAQTTQLYARVNAAIEPEWLAEVAAHLVKHTVSQPVWNPQRGEVTAQEQVTLLGLPLLKRSRHYGSYEPAGARKLFIEHALVRGEWPAMPQFLEKNLALIEEIREQEARLRRPDLLGDESQLFAFYDARIPPDVCTTATLKSWLRRVDGPQLAGRSLRMQEADALRAGASTDVKAQFPDHIDISGHAIALSYTHDPGADADGVSFHVPLPLLFALDADAFDWLVPGLRAPRIEGLIRTLPNHLRRQCSPIAEYATALANSVEPRGPQLPALCARFKAMTGVELQPSDFEPAKLEAHLEPRLVLVDEKGATLADADSLPALQRRFAGSARDSINRVAEQDDTAARWTREDVRDWDFGALPESVTLAGGIKAYPGLAARAQSVALQLFESPAARERESHAGVRALLLARMPERLREIEKKARTQFALKLPGLGLTAEALARQLAERVADTLLTAPVTDATGFQRALEGRAQFSMEAQKRLDAIGTWLQHAAEVRRRVEALGKQWPEAQADIGAQLDSLFAPGFVAAIPEAQWSRIAVYLRALNIRLDRLPNKPQRDLELTVQVKPLQDKLPAPFHPARWVVEEWRVALFAQELKAMGAPNRDKVLQTL